MTCFPRDLTLEEALADPMIGAVLKADRVDRRGFEMLLRTTARRLDPGRDAAARTQAVIAARARCAMPTDLAAW